MKGLKIPFKKTPHQNFLPNKISFSDKEVNLIQIEIDKLLDKRIISKVCDYYTGFISNIFTRQKKDGTVRLILNLKKLNEFIDTAHFKMETPKSAISLITPNCYFASCDI